MFQIEDCPDCGCDSLTLLDDREIVDTICGYDRHNYFVSKTNELALKFSSDDSINFSGFLVEYEEIN